MTKKVLLERIKKLEEVVGSEDTFVNNALSCWGLPTKKLGWVIQSFSKEIDTLRETQNLLLEYLKLEVKTIPGTPERKEIQTKADLNVGGIILSTMDGVRYPGDLSTPSQPQCCKNPNKKPLKKKR